MNTTQHVVTEEEWPTPLKQDTEAQLVFAFGSRGLIKKTEVLTAIRQAYPQADIVGCTTSGEINGRKIYDDSLCLSAVRFNKATVNVFSLNAIEDDLDQKLPEVIQALNRDGLKSVFVLSDGQHVNGTHLVNNLRINLPKDVVTTGGLAGDDDRFAETVLWHNHEIQEGLVILIGFYGDSLSVKQGSMGGWEPFGPARVVSKSKRNVLYELDHQPALSIYKKYLGDKVEELPASALLFPLEVTYNGETYTRTILNIDHINQTMSFAGDIPEGSTVRLMLATTSGLLDASEIAAEQAKQDNLVGQGLALLVSCVGRRLVLKSQTEDEIEAVADVFGDKWCTTGFYSYGELSHASSSQLCVMQNQTLTTTTICERDE